MRILFLSQVLPYPLDAGPKMRSYFALRHLVQNHEVTLLTFVRDTDRQQDIDHLAQICHDIHVVPMQRGRIQDVRFFVESLLTQQPFLITRDQVSAMTEKINELIDAHLFDAVHVDQLWMAQYGLAAKNRVPGLKTVLDQHNAVYLIPQRMANDETSMLKRKVLERETRMLKMYEAEVCKQYDHVVWVTDEDRRAVSALLEAQTQGLAPSTVIPICADPSATEPVQPASGRKRVTFLGGLHWPPNAQGVVWFANEVFPLVRQAVPNAVLTIIGKSPPAGIAGDNVEVTGYVAETDLPRYLAETAAFVVPLHAGGGMRVKILDAWSWGLPIVSTTIGAEGINTAHDHDILIADTAPSFAQEVIRLLEAPQLGKMLARNGRRTVMEKYNWRVIYSAWDDVYQMFYQQNGVH